MSVVFKRVCERVSESSCVEIQFSTIANDQSCGILVVFVLLPFFIKENPRSLLPEAKLLNLKI